MANKKAFTLTELLVALGIIGALAAMAIPSLLNSINKKILTTQIKNFAASVQQVANDQMVVHNTRKLENTDFANASTLMSDFDTAKTCATLVTSTSDCWKDTTYRTLNSVTNSNSSSSPPPSVSPQAPGSGSSVYMSAVLNNGAAVYYQVSKTSDNSYTTNDNVIGYFIVDVNGTDAPNIYGRDAFGFYITNRGKIVTSTSKATADGTTLATNKANCKTGSLVSCFAALSQNSWKMDY